MRVHAASSLAYLAITCLSIASAFSPIGSLSSQKQPRCIGDDRLPTFRTNRGSTVEANLFRKMFGRDKKDGEDGGDEVMDATDTVDGAPFFAQTETGEQTPDAAPVDFSEPLESTVAESSSEAAVVATAPAPAPAAAAAAAAPPMASAPPVPSPPSPPPPPKPLTPQEQAKQLRAAAERTRLEAEKMEAVLSLEKISKLEKELGTKAVEKDPDRAAQIRRDIDSLKRKLNGEDVAPVPSPRPAKSVEGSEVATSDDSSVERNSLVTATAVIEPTKKTFEPLPANELQERVQKYEQAPKFMREIVARTAGIDFMDVSEVNATALVMKLHEDELKYLDFEKVANFSQEQIDAKVKELENVPQFVKNLYGKDANNDTAIALQMLQTDYESDNMKRQLMRSIEEHAENTREGPTLSPTNKPSGTDDKTTSGSSLFGEMEEKTEIERMMESLYPKSTRKEGMVPSQAQANILMADVMTKIKRFSPSGKPEEVPGGYVIRGTSKYDNGQELIDAIDDALEKSRVREQLLVHYVSDPTPVSEDQMMVGERPPVLFVTSTDIAREGNRLALVGVTSLAIGATWYNSLYPFLLNPNLLKSSEEQLNLANAGMEYDLNFLTNMAIPLFAAFMGTQIVHEAAHWAVASSKKMEITFPTLVPSLVTGVTSSITALKKSPKNKQDLFDFAIVGPLAGIIASCALLFLGCGITATLDSASYAQLPALPLAVLRQSALAGGIMEYILGDGMLSVPASAAGTAALADVNISLHPFAIAGFFGLVVNAINLVPYGRTDGGRVALALFGRSGSQVAGFFALIALFLQGIFSSDLLLFYFAFITFFQSENEIPCRNEVDDIDFSRVLLS
eukprot:CAMPEP_0181025234 /NCGR_PEP_ID=MMETSP1070-20121207/2994_1 /TAXON_ID=265543 /ORGANISM="Minutocellus polymorphus, Strain NH13" /LENGTH=849 /DNA_ID=CAMNT_0023102339 /DNA_START=39 /DNA_END=2585 /DNA_ORIENTATION=-